jgi:hypothetical protein
MRSTAARSRVLSFKKTSNSAAAFIPFVRIVVTKRREAWLHAACLPTRDHAQRHTTGCTTSLMLLRLCPPSPGFRAALTLLRLQSRTVVLAVRPGLLTRDVGPVGKINEVSASAQPAQGWLQNAAFRCLDEDYEAGRSIYLQVGYNTRMSCLPGGCQSRRRRTRAR